MDTYLDPVTLEKLREFEKRRKKLIKIRGICAVVITVLGSMSLIAFVDLLLVLPDVARISLSLFAYALTAFVLYVTCLKWYIHKVDIYDLARMFESGGGDLQEEVLTAVELGLPKGKIYDSIEFRRVLQSRVANLVKGYSLKSLLPISVIKNWTAAAAVILFLCAALLMVPRLQFGKLMARAMAPTANLSRVSALQISIVEPSDPQVITPKGDPVTIVAQLSKPGDHRVYIESLAGPEEAVTMQMEPAGNNRYSSTLLVAGGELIYRIYAGKASTKYYTITSRERPYVKKFIKNYIYPGYSRMENEQKEEITGDIRGLQGTIVELKIQTDQPVNTARLWIDYPEGRKEIDLNISDPQLLTGKLELLEPATYRVHLKASLTDFENKFAPTYEIDVVPDLIPSIKIEKPMEDLILPSDEIVSFEGTALDDLGLDSVKHLVRVNRQAWQEHDLPGDYGKRYDIQRNLDLLNLQLRPGDQVYTRFIAVDIKGNRGESRTMRITVSSPGYSVERMNNLQQAYNLRQLLLGLRSAALQVKNDFQNIRDQVIINPENTDLIRRKIIAVQADAEQVEMIAFTAWNAVLESMQKTNSKRKWQDLMLIGRMLSRIRHEHLWHLHLSLDLSEKEWKLTEKDLQEIEHAGNSLESRSNQLRDAHEKMLELEALDNIIHEMNRLAVNQQAMLKEARDQLKDASELDKEAIFRRLTRQIKSSVREQEIIEKLVDDFSGYAEYNQARNARNIHNDLSKRRFDLEEKLEAGRVPDENLPAELNEMASKLMEYRDNLADKRKTSRQRVGSKRKELIGTLARTSDTINNLKWKLDSYSGNRKGLIGLQSKANVEADKIKEQQDKVYRSFREVEMRWSSSIGQLHDRGRLEELAVNPLYMFVNDNINTACALEVMEDTAEKNNTVDDLYAVAKDVEIIQKAYRLLEVGSGFEYETNLVADIHVMEKWDFSRQNQNNQSMDQWPEVVDMLKTYTSQLSQTSVPKEFRDDMYRFLKGQAARKMSTESDSRKKNSDHEMTDMTENLQQALSDLQDFNYKLQPYMQQAREVIMKYAPSLVDQLKNAARQSKELQLETANYMEQNDTNQPPEQTRLEINQLMQKQRELNTRIQTVRNALRRDANVQDMSTKEGAERARDGDDSIAILRDPPQKAENYLRNAAISSDTNTQDRAIDMANVQQEKLSDALDLIARHYENLESGNPEETRLALRQAEEMLDNALAVQQDYEKIDELSSLQQMTPEELMQYLEHQLPENMYMQQELDRIVDDTLQLTRTDLENMVDSEKDISEKLDNIASEQDPADEYAEKFEELMNKAKDLVQEARQLADDDIQKAVDMTKQADVQDASGLIEKAQDDTHKSAERLADNTAADPGLLSRQMRDFSRDLDHVSQDLHEAAGKTEPASKEVDENQNQTPKAGKAEAATDITRKSEAKAKQLADIAGNLSEQLAQLDNEKDASGLAETNRQLQEMQKRANELADKAEEMHSRQIPKLSQDAQQYVENPIEGFQDARNASHTASGQMPRKFDDSPQQLARQVEDYARSMNLAQEALKSASKDLQKIPAREKRQGAGEVIEHTQNTRQQAGQLENDARQLANDLQGLAQRRNEMMHNTPQQQREINRQAPKVSADMTRAAMHARRLNFDNANQLRDTAEAMQQITNHELPAARDALDTSSSARTAKDPVDEAYTAMSRQLKSMDEAMLANSDQNSQPSEMDSQSQPAQEGQWMARTLDQLQAAELSQQQALNQKAAQAAKQPLNNQANRMARSRNMSMSQQQSTSLTRYMSSAMNNNQTSTRMPGETNRRLTDRVVLRNGRWGQLRQLDSKDLIEGDSEAISEEYKDMVHTYFRVITERAGQNN